ncbi:MAG: aldo/keto reductase [Deltaproteobacteria bacterium]|nr:aldo/keto reductase [Deltaproteobacteria bacterium]
MSEPPIGLGCMRVPEGDAGVDVLRAALDAGVTLFDTAASYGPEKKPHHNERQLAEALGERSASVTVVTKAGMKRGRGRWMPNGKRKTILADATASAEALGRAPDVLLLHLPDPSTAFETSVRALIAARDAGLCHAVGLSNVTLGQLEAARALTEIAMVQLAVGPFDEEAVRGGVVERCVELGIPVLAHSPLGGPKKPRRLTDDADLRWLAESHEVTPQTIVLAWLRSLGVIPIPGVSRIETARAAAARLVLRDDERALLDDRFPLGRLLRTKRSARAVTKSRREVVVFVGIPAAGKTTAATALVRDDYLRLSRDERGGTLKGLAQAMGEALEEGTERVLMDATYPTRAGRSRVLEGAWEQGAQVRCIHFDTPIEEAQINAVDRMLERKGELLAGDALTAAGKEDPNLFPPHAQFRYRDRFEAPSPEEGFAAIEVRPFERRPVEGHDRAGLLLDLGALVVPARWRRGEAIDADRLKALVRPETPTLVMAWLPEGEGRGAAELSAEVAAIDPSIAVGVCTHAAGPARCWCRPPLPGLPVAWLRGNAIAPAKVTMLGASSTAERLAETLGFLYRPHAP